MIVSAGNDDGSPETGRFATRRGAAAFLARPVDLRELRATVRVLAASASR